MFIELPDIQKLVLFLKNGNIFSRIFNRIKTMISRKDIASEEPVVTVGDYLPDYEYPDAVSLPNVTITLPPKRIKTNFWKSLKNYFSGNTSTYTDKPIELDLSNGHFQIEDINKQGNDPNLHGILFNEFDEPSNRNTVRTAKDFINTEDTQLGDGKIPLSSISRFYGFENGKFKVGAASDFNLNTTIIPIRNKDELLKTDLDIWDISDLERNAMAEYAANNTSIWKKMFTRGKLDKNYYLLNLGKAAKIVNKNRYKSDMTSLARIGADSYLHNEEETNNWQAPVYGPKFILYSGDGSNARFYSIGNGDNNRTNKRIKRKMSLFSKLYGDVHAISIDNGAYYRYMYDENNPVSRSLYMSGDPFAAFVSDEKPYPFYAVTYRKRFGGKIKRI